MSDDQKVVVSAVVQWSHLQVPDSYQGNEPKFKVTLTQISDKAAEAMRAAGGVVRDAEFKNKNGVAKPEYGNHVVISQAKRSFAILFADGSECEEELGNGSVVRAKLFLSTLTRTGAINPPTWKLSALVVDNLVDKPGSADQMDDAL